jgi:hypothetical protein
MNFSSSYDHLTDGDEWRGVRTTTHHYARWRNGRTELFDIRKDPRQLHDLTQDPASAPLCQQLEARLIQLMAERGEPDGVIPACTSYESWFDAQRRVVRNAWGPIRKHPESMPEGRFGA